MWRRSSNETMTAKLPWGWNSLFRMAELKGRISYSSVSTNPIQISHGVTPSKTLHFVREKQTSLLLKTLASVSLILAAAVLTDINISQLSLSCLICDVHIKLDGYIRIQMILGFYKFIFNSVLFSITYFLVGQMDFSSVLCNYSTFISTFNVSTECQHLILKNRPTSFCRELLTAYTWAHSH